MRHINFFNVFLVSPLSFKYKHLVSEIKTGTHALSKAANGNFPLTIPLSPR